MIVAWHRWLLIGLLVASLAWVKACAPPGRARAGGPITAGQALAARQPGPRS